MKKNQLISVLKVLSIIIFLIISRNGPHVSIPFGFVFYAFFNDFFVLFKNNLSFALSTLLSITGIILILFSFRKNKNYLSIIGYLLTFTMVLGSYLEGTVFKNPEKEVYFFITSGIYIIISIFIIMNSIKEIKKVSH